MNVRVIGMIAGAALVAATGASSSAAVVVYDNTAGEFKWWSGIHFTDHSERDGTFLDITQPPSQTGERRPGTLGKWYRPNETSSNPAIRQFAGEAGVETPQTDEGVFLWWNDQWIKPRITREYLPGELITTEANWEQRSNYFYHLPFSGEFSEGTPAISELAYIAVRTKLSDRWHYGWILFADYMTPLKWAYETEPDVLIQVPVPAPGVAVGFVLGGVFFTPRRTRR